MSDDLWRNFVNSNDKMPVDGTGPPELEMFSNFAPESAELELEENEIFVQKIITEIYVFTDSNKQMFGEHTFQDMVILGKMSQEKFIRLLNRQKKKHDKG